MGGQTIQEIFLKNINSKEESGITFIEGKNSIQYLSYKKLYLEASYKLYALQQKGLCPGDELVFQFQSNKNFVITFWACVLGGLIPVPIVVGTTSDIVTKLTTVWGKLNNPFIITDIPIFKKILQEFNSEHQEVIEDISSKFIYNEELIYTKKATPVYATSSDLVFVQFSSGSTGSPKGVTNTQESILYNVGVSFDKLEVTGLDKFLGWMPLTHDMGLIFFHILPLLSNANQFLMSPMLFLSKPEIWIESLSEQQITISGSPNFGFVHVLENMNRTMLENLSFDKLRVLINSAEPVSVDVCRKFEEALADRGLAKNTINPSYGLAEAVLGVSAYYREKEDLKEFSLDRGQLSIGDKVQFLDSDSDNMAFFADLGSFEGTEIKITNETNKKLNEDTLGIIKLRSPAITSGYYNDSEASEKVLSKDGWFNTGDIGFLHEDHLIITGRHKEMIIINGQNYFPNDLDSLLESLSEIKFQHAISCNVFDEKKHQDELFVFVQYTGAIEDFATLSNAIKKIISDRIGISVRKVVMVDKIPRTTSGKIQRYVLRDKYLKGDYEEFLSDFEKVEDSLENDSYVAPSTDLEKNLAKIWEDHFGIERVGVEDNFFFLGGNSIGMAVLASKIQEVLGVQVDVQELFTKIDFKDQLELISNTLEKPRNDIKLAPVKDNYPLFNTQKRLFMLHQIDPQSISYNTPVVLKVDGFLDVQLCEDVFKKIIDRHEILRTSFDVLNGEPIQKIHNNVDFSIQYIKNEAGNIQDLLKNHTTPFDLSTPPLIRVLICKENNIPRKIILDVHHIVIDAASFELLIQEFQILYTKGSLEPLKFQYKDFVEYEEEKLKEKQLDSQKEFWLNQYFEAPQSLNIPFDSPKTDSETNSNGDTVSFEIDIETEDNLKEICRQQEVTMSTLMLSIFYILLAKLTSQEDIVIGTSTLGRWRNEFKDLIGLFINTLPLRAYPKGDAKFLEFLEDVKKHILACVANEEYSFDRLLTDLELKSNSSGNPLFNLTFEYHNFDWSKIELPDGSISRIDQPNLFSKFDLVLRVVEKEDRCKFNLDYNTNRFRRETVECFASYYTRIIQEVIRNKDTSLKNINILTKKDTSQLLNEFNDTAVYYEKDNTIIDVFSEQVLLKPEDKALVFGKEHLSYKGLDSQSTFWARKLVEYKVKPGDVVGIMMTRSIEMITAMFAIMKAGATYLPIDVDLPISRKKHMLEQCSVKTLLTNIKENPLEFELYNSINVLELSDQKNQDLGTTLPKLTTENLMYIIFTSGSTGEPKGVMVRQKSIINLVKGLEERVYNKYEGKSLQVALLASYAFDASAQQIFGALLQGHTLHVANNETRKDGVNLRLFYNENKIDLSDGTPTHLRFFVDALEENSTLDSLSSWILAGEVLPKELVKAFHLKLGTGVQLYNFYGPTEACVDSTGFKIIPEELDAHDHIPIGKPLPNERIYITDQYGHLVPVGSVGELCIAGDGLALGYLGDSVLTSTKFDSEWIPGEERVYRTGDMARWLHDGNLEYHGRRDDHAKIRGYRIHLGEIEASLNRLPSVKQSVVIVHEDGDNQQLVGYIVAEKELDNQEVQRILEVDLPEYMVPRVYVYLPFFPMTNSGKIDKKSLPLPDSSSTYVEPVNELEKQMVLLWQDILGVKKIGIYDNFYELGGDSIKAIQLASKSKAIGLHFQVKDIFNHQTISEIVSHIKSVDSSLKETGLLSGEVVLHPIQKHFFERDYEVVSHYNQSILLKVSKSITKETLDFSLSELAKQHDVLRMNYQKSDDSAYPLQTYGSLVPEVLIEELSSLNDLTEICNKYQSDLDIFKGDLIRFIWLKTPAEEFHNRLFIAIHHLVVDGVSLRILIEDLTNLIENHVAGNKTSFPIKGTSYRQWTKQLSNYASSVSLKKEKIYWKEVLSNYTPLPVDTNYNEKISYEKVGKIKVSLPSDLTSLLVQEVHNKYKTDINDILISALTITLSRWIDASSIVIGLEGHGREEVFEDVDINRTVGWFTSLYPVSLNLSEVKDIGMLIADTKDMLRGIPNKGIGFNILRSESNSQEIKSDLSIFYEDLIFNYLGSFDNSFSSENESLVYMAEEATGSTINMKNSNAHRISIDSIIINGSLHLEWNYDTKRYKNSTIQELADSYITALVNILSLGDAMEENSFRDENFEILSL